MTLINKQLRVSVDPDNEGQIIITWPVEADFTAYAGQLDVHFVGKSSTGEEIIKLQSNGLQFAASVEGTAAPPKNVFENTLEQMQGLLDNAENAAAQSAADASRAENAQEAAGQSAQTAQQAQEGTAQSVVQNQALVQQIEGDAEAAAASAAAAAASAAKAEQLAQGCKGWFVNVAALRAAYPTGTDGESLEVRTVSGYGMRIPPIGLTVIRLQIFPTITQRNKPMADFCRLTAMVRR